MMRTWAWTRAEMTREKREMGRTSFIGRMAIPFALEHMAQMSPAIGARDLSSDSSKAALCTYKNKREKLGSPD